MAISDLALNPIAAGGSSGQMVGYIEPPAPGEALTLDMYEFLIKEIREEDRKNGQLFVQRFLEGPQALWNDTHNKIFSIKDLWSITDCPDEYLQYLKNIVGWTKELDSITSGLDDDTLRRLIHASVPLWQSRSSEQSYSTVINLIFSERSRVWNWFDFRWITGETFMGEQRQGIDPWLLAFPGTPLNREYWTTIRVVDPGVSNRQALVDVLDLMRPMGERLNIVYLLFLDKFDVADDLNQWLDLASTWTTDNAIVEDGKLKLSDTDKQGVLSSVTDSENWVDYVVSARVRGTASTTPGSGNSYGIAFYVEPTNIDGYFTSVDVDANKLYFGTIASGVMTTTNEFDMSTVPYTLQPNVWYGFRVECLTEGSTTRFKVFFNGVKRFDLTDATYTKGTIGVVHEQTVTSETDEIEVLGLPIESDTIEPS